MSCYLFCATTWHRLVCFCLVSVCPGRDWMTADEFQLARKNQVTVAGASWGKPRTTLARPCQRGCLDSHIVGLPHISMQVFQFSSVTFSVEFDYVQSTTDAVMKRVDNSQILSKISALLKAFKTVLLNPQQIRHFTEQFLFRLSLSEHHSPSPNRFPPQHC